MDLSANIKELLYKNDCVIIPDIGGFVTQLSPASIDIAEQLVTPPNKRISFNIKLNHDDGLIANHLVQQKDITFNEARLIVEQYCQRVEDDLFNNKIVHFHQLGKLFFNTDGKLEFVPEKCNLRIDSYGLPELDCIPVLRDKSYLSNTIKPNSPTTGITYKKTVNNGLFRKLAIACSLILICLATVYGPTYFGKTNNIVQLETSSKDSTSGTASAAILPISTSTNDSSQQNQITETEPLDIEPQSEANSTDNSETPEVVENDEAVEADEVLENYIIVLGAFGKKKNADRLSKKLAADNYLPDVTFKNGLNRVGVQISCTADELKGHLQFLQENYNPKAWVVE